MKKLNRKGFTLVELLAVIIILAIVVGITIPAVLTTTSKAKTNAFQTAANSVANWFDRQYQVAKTGLASSDVATLDAHFSNFCGETGANCEKSGEITKAIVQAPTTTSNFVKITDANLIAASGVTTANVEAIYVRINSGTGRTCVILAAKENGDYYKAGNNNYNNKGKLQSNYMQSSYCPASK